MIKKKEFLIGLGTGLGIGLIFLVVVTCVSCCCIMHFKAKKVQKFPQNYEKGKSPPLNIQAK